MSTRSRTRSTLEYVVPLEVCGPVGSPTDGCSLIWMDPTRVDASLGQNLGWVYDSTPSRCASYKQSDERCEGSRTHRMRTSSRACRILPSRAPTSSARTRPLSMTSGITLAAMRTAINNDAIGSNPVHP